MVLGDRTHQLPDVKTPDLTHLSQGLVGTLWIQCNLSAYVQECPLRRNEDGKGEGEEDGWIQEEVKLAQLCQHYQHCVNIISTVHCALYSVPR